MSKLNFKTVGILGGSFDPPHKGHVKITKISLNKIKISEVHWIVAKKNPFKKKTHYSLKDRIFRSKKALKNIENAKVLYIDDKIKSSRMIKVINFYVKKKKKKKLYLIIGSDCLLDFHKWTSWKKIAKLAKLVVFSRKGYDKKSRESIAVKYINKKNIHFVNNKPIVISSTSIKQKKLKTA
tara:strand:+ start:2728 stop:3270 length:543 start_codon:yes stop_codon:yes gene_type:complete